MRKTYKAELDVDDDRGVIYVHLTDPDDAVLLGLTTPVRIKVMHFHPEYLLPIDIISKTNRIYTPL